jgi:hypothetical protein
MPRWCSDARRVKQLLVPDCAAVFRQATRRTATAAVLATTCALMACGSGDDAKRFGTVTDCAKVGRVTAAADPAGDQRGGKAGAPPAPYGDLTALRVARGGGRLCAEFRAKAPIKPYAAFLLVLRPRDTATPVVQVEATVLAGQKPSALLNPGGSRGAFRKIAADVGIDGSRLTLAVGRAEFARLGLGSLFDAFRFQGRSAVAAEDDVRYTDCVPACT